MVLKTIKTSIKDHRMILLFVCIAVLSSLFQTTAAARKVVNCRKYVHAPECRGIAAKRDISSHLNEDYRYPQDETEQLLAEKSAIMNNQILNSRTLLSELVRKILESEKPAEYDTGTGNYILAK